MPGSRAIGRARKQGGSRTMNVSTAKKCVRYFGLYFNNFPATKPCASRWTWLAASAVGASTRQKTLSQPSFAQYLR